MISFDFFTVILIISFWSGQNSITMKINMLITVYSISLSQELKRTIFVYIISKLNVNDVI